jgi:hypothetical protein|nr:MAG TPA: hypothetical protein [Caudoviricetes sp.]
MIKASCYLIKWDKPSRYGVIFSNTCKVRVPNFVPVVDFTKPKPVGNFYYTEPPEHSEPIGMVISRYRDEHGIKVDMDIVYGNKEKTLIELMANKEVLCSGRYTINKLSEKNGITVADDITLKSVDLYHAHDIFCPVDKDLTLEVKRND